MNEVMDQDMSNKSPDVKEIPMPLQHKVGEDVAMDEMVNEFFKDIGVKEDECLTSDENHYYEK